MKGCCENCGTEIEVKMCCSGYECGCMGQPVEPTVCSEHCYYKAYPHQILSDKITQSQLLEFETKFNELNKEV